MNISCFRFPCTLPFYLLLLVCSNHCWAQQKELWGTVPFGAEKHGGALFSTDSNGNALSIRHYFEVEFPGSVIDQSQLAEDSTGTLFGIMRDASDYYSSILFSYSPKGDEYRVEQRILSTEGLDPLGILEMGSNGKFYTAYGSGGKYNAGTVVEVDIYSRKARKILDINDSLLTAKPSGLKFSKNGKLYATCYGSQFEDGSFFEIDLTNGNVKKLYDFGGLNGYGPRGLIVETDTGVFLGTTHRGGKLFDGVIYQINTNTGKFTKKVDFDGNKTFGCQLSNGKIYGYDLYASLLFEYDPNTNAVNDLMQFDQSVHGYSPRGIFTQIAPDQFIGINAHGGPHGHGVLYRYTPSKKEFVSFRTFKNYKQGAYPSGGRLLGKNGKLYSLCWNGGIEGGGCLFELNLTNGVYTKFWDVGYSPLGASPSGTPVQVGNKLYGVANGGVNGNGVLYSFDFNKGVYKKCADFDVGPTGEHPQGDLLLAPNGKLYGTCSHGGNQKSGVLFEFDITGQKLSKKVNFNGHTTGRIPSGNLLLAKNGKIYGTTVAGMRNAQNSGHYSYGTFFEYNPSNGVHQVKHYFQIDTTGSDPHGNLVEGDSGKIYGTVQQKTGAYGGIFEFNPTSQKVTLRAAFQTDSMGKHRGHGLIVGKNGKFYGFRREGGSNRNGVLYEYNPKTHALRTKAELTAEINGDRPAGFPFEATNGKLYGMANVGGKHDKGTLFEYDFQSDSITVKYHFDLEKTGGYPGLSSLIEVDVCRSTCDSISVQQCHPYLAPNGQDTFYKTGVYVDTLRNKEGCDSIIIVNLEIRNLNPSVTILNDTFRVDSSDLNYQWFTCDTGYVIIDSAVSRTYKPSESGKYAVEISWQACKDTSACFEVIVTDLEHVVTSLSVFPNPSRSHITIRSSIDYKNADVLLYDITGKQTVIKRHFSGSSLTHGVASLNPGIYYLVVRDELNTEKQKIIVER